LLGQVPTRISAENGDVTVGEPLTASPTRPGYAMKATNAGRIIGYALEPYTEASPDDVILAFVSVGSYAGQGTNQLIGTENTASELGDLPDVTDLGSFEPGESLSELDTTENLSIPGVLSDVVAIAGLDGLWTIGVDGTFSTQASYDVVIELENEEVATTHATLSREHKITLSGTGTLTNGTALISFEDIDPLFNDITSELAPVRVLVTLRGPANGIYVLSADAQGFVAQETMGGTSGAAFDWYVEAYRKGFEPEEFLPEEDLLVEGPAEEGVVEEQVPDEGSGDANPIFAEFP
jgi:hypothetical protein